MYNVGQTSKTLAVVVQVLYKCYVFAGVLSTCSKIVDVCENYVEHLTSVTGRGRVEY